MVLLTKRITIDREIGKKISEEIIGKKEVDDMNFLNSYLDVVTGMNADEFIDELLEKRLQGGESA